MKGRLSILALVEAIKEVAMAAVIKEVGIFLIQNNNRYNICVQNYEITLIIMNLSRFKI